MPQARPLLVAEVLALLREAGQAGQGVLRAYLAHLVAQGSTDAGLHTQLALQLASWAASLLPAASPRCTAPQHFCCSPQCRQCAHEQVEWCPPEG